MMQLAKQEQLAKFQPILKTSIFRALEATLSTLRGVFRTLSNIYQISIPFWSVFSRFRTEYGEIPCFSLFSPNAGKHGPENF